MDTRMRLENRSSSPIVGFSFRATEQSPTANFHHEEEHKSVNKEMAHMKFFWQERMDSIIPLKLPYENDSKDGENRWETSSWSDPLLDDGVRDAKMILLDAFVIYLARLTGENNIHVGWRLTESEIEPNHMGGSAVVVPMVVTVPMDEPWSSVSKIVDAELAILADNCALRWNPASRQVLSSVRTRPWSIVISRTERHLRTEDDHTVSGRVLTLEIDDHGGFRWTYDASALSPDVFQRMSEHLRELVADFVVQKCNEVPVSRLNLLSKDERTVLLAMWNSTADQSPDTCYVHRVFELRVSETPTAVALVYENHRMTYADLNAQANRLAHKLIESKVVPEKIVAICVSNPVTMLVSTLAVLKAGGAVLPLDPTYPGVRLIECLDDVGTDILICDDLGCRVLLGFNFSRVTVIGPEGHHSLCDENPEVTLTTKNLAYIMYTSGTTGQPNGVMVEHINVCASASSKVFTFTKSDVWCMFHSIAFSFAMWEYWGALVNGAKLVLVSQDDARSPDARRRVIIEHGVTVLGQTPSDVRALVSQFGSNAIPDHVRYVFFTGESLNSTTLQLLFDAGKGTLPTFVNVYGSTETRFAIYKVLDRRDIGKSVCPIGAPFQNVALYLLDTHRQPVPLGAVGEVYIRSRGVARGYLNRSDLTQERFLDDPFEDSPGARMYRTGDLAKFSPDGSLILVCRTDRCTKIRGYRIEAAEVEARLREHESVKDALVLTVGEESDKRLVAYVVAENIKELPRKLYAHLTVRLPAYMIPTAFVRLERFPLTINGKLDTKALESLIDESSFVHERYEAPRGEVEMCLGRIWQNVLDIERVSRHDSFFALGGHSLIAMRMIQDMRFHGLTLTMRNVFEYPILWNLAQTVELHKPFTAPANVWSPDGKELTAEMLPLIDLKQSNIDQIVSLVPGGLANVQDIYQLSPTQDGILFHYLLSTSGDPYLVTKVLAFSDRDRLNCYLKAFQNVVDRHDILRTCFFWQGLSVPAQVVCRRASIPVVELTLDVENGPIHEQLSRSYGPGQFKIDLGVPPLARMMVTRIADGRWILFSCIHHLIYDASTARMMSTEIVAHLNGCGAILGPSVPFRNHIAQLRQRIDHDDHVRFFTAMLVDVDQPTLPFDLVTLPDDVTRMKRSNVTLDPELNLKLRTHVRSLGVSLAVMCHLAWGLVVSRTSGNGRVVFGTVLFGRSWAGTSSNTAMGPYVNTLPLKLDIDETPVCTSVYRVHAQLAQLLEHEHASLALVQRCSRIACGTPLFSSLLNYRYDDSMLDDKTHEGRFEVLQSEDQTHYPLVLSVSSCSRITLEIQGLEPVEPTRVCSYVKEALKKLAVASNDSSKMTICSVDVLPEAERAMLLETWNNPVKSVPVSKCLHQLFEERVSESPFSTAVIFENESLTYAELNIRANRLAHHLIGLGVKPDSLVGLCVSVSPGMLVGLLAVLKAGGAYVPLDPSYPKHRILGIITDTSLNIVIADEIGICKLEEAASAFSVIDPNVSFSQLEADPRVYDLSAQNLAYIIHTSGSTGSPKGVMVEHRNVVRLFRATEDWFGFNQLDVWCLFHSISFDVSVWEIWGALGYGGHLVLMARDVARCPETTYHLISKRCVTVLNQTPSAFRARVDTFISNPFPERLRLVILAGESFDPRDLRPLYTAHGNILSRFVNMYGTTETTVHATYKDLTWQDTLESSSLIGVRLPDTRIYLLDEQRRLVPVGVVGELYISGAGVARGYLNRPDLTNECFFPDPFHEDKGDRMYKTGDLARCSPDGGLVFLGRRDQQYKVRGYRIEAGEVEACLKTHPAVRGAVVLALGAGLDKRLVAYVAADDQNRLAAILHSYTTTVLPEYMVPSAIVRVDVIPLTQNGKVDLRALPTVGGDSLAQQIYEDPHGDVETALAEIWLDLLKLDRVGRQDSFFALGGHSLLAVRMVDRMRCLGHRITVHDLFLHPVLFQLAKTVKENRAVSVPENVIVREVPRITPEMLPLIDLTQKDIDRIISEVPGGADNIKDIYALSPLQDGILFHHLMATEGDPYLWTLQFAFIDRIMLDRYISAMHRVIERHDIMRTVFFWSELTQPAQVVLRRATLSVTEFTPSPDDGPASDQLMRLYDPRSYRIDLQQAPLMRFFVARDSDGSWVVIQLLHHLISDHWMLDIVNVEVKIFLEGRDELLPSPIPFRNHVANARSSLNQEAHVEFFSAMLSDVDQPVMAFGLTEMYRDSFQVVESSHTLPLCLCEKVRLHAKHLNVSPATICHLAWGLVVSKVSGQPTVVFGTVLLGCLSSERMSQAVMASFINTLPIRIDIDETIVKDSIRRTHNALALLMKHQHASLLLAQRCCGIANGTPLFNTLLNFRHNSILVRGSEIMDGIRFIRALGRTNYPLTLSIDDDGSGMVTSCQTIQPVDPDRVRGYMQQGLEFLGASLDSKQPVSIRSISVIPENERKILLGAVDHRVPTRPDVACIHQLFEKRVVEDGTATALVYENETLTYKELNARANRLAHHLINLGVIPDSLVGICVSVSPGMLVGMLAILKAGGAYVPLDLAHPEQRLIDIMDSALLNIVIADEIGSKKLEATNFVGRVFIDPNLPIMEPNTNPTIRNLRSSHLAYVMYTSGSTGQPKGVMVEHGNIVRMLDASDSWFRFDKFGVWCLLHSLAFDFSVWEIWGALHYGGRLVLASSDVIRCPEATFNLICNNKITVLNQTPSALRACIYKLTEKPIRDCLRSIILGGESLDPRILNPLYVTRGDAAPRIINMYGPTETTVYATVKVLDRTHTRQSQSFIGQPLGGSEVYLLDNGGQPVPQGVVGEVYVAGTGVARGYLNRPDLTGHSFLTDAFSDSVYARMYKTGDLARLLPDGNLVIIGRNDQQIKVRGFRIELAEIEHRLRSHSAVVDAVVLAVGEEGDKRLVAYIVSEITDDLATVLHDYLASQLPEYMIPSAFLKLEKLPLTPNGKLDTRALPSVDETSFLRGGYEAPETEIEMTLATVWKNLFGLEDVSRRDSFFALGGHSLLAMRVMDAMRIRGITVTIQDIFKYPVLSDLARTVESHQPLVVPPNVISPNLERLTPDMLPLIDLLQTDIDQITSEIPGGVANIQDIYELSPLQNGILFHHLLSPDNDSYLSTRMIAFGSYEQLSGYLTALQSVINRHDILRTSFFWEGISVPAQVVWRRATISLTQVTLENDNETPCEELSRRYGPRVSRININEAPLMRLVISRESNGRWIMLSLIHHIIYDERTAAAMETEILARFENHETSLSPPIQFRNLIAAVRQGLSNEEHMYFFTEMLADIDEPTLPFGLIHVHGSHTKPKQSSIELDETIVQQMRRHARSLEVSLSIFCHLAWALIASRSSNRRRIVFGTVLSSRMRAGKIADAEMGLYINTLPVRLNIDETPVCSSVRNMQVTLANLLKHKHASLVSAQRCSHVPHGTPLFSSLMNYRHKSLEHTNKTSPPPFEVLQTEGNTNYPLVMSVDDDDEKLSLEVQVVDRVEPFRICNYMREALANLTVAIANSPEQSICSIEVLPENERTLLLEAWNHNSRSTPDLTFVHRLFERQVQLRPLSTALVHEDETLTYEELNIRANRLARRLTGSGVVPESLVGICVSVSPAMIVALIAVLKAGGAYVPLDPDQPQQRLRDILIDAAVRIVIADEIGREKLGTSMLTAVTFIDPNARIAEKDANPFIQDLRLQNLAYVIYTSGSTGKPKGVMVEYRNMATFFDAMESRFHCDQHDVWCGFHSIAFDFSLWEIWGALRNGGRLVLMPRNVVRSSEATYSLICESKVTVLNQTPGGFRACVHKFIEQPIRDCLRCLILGGDLVDPTILHTFRAARKESSPQFFIMYGVTETTVFSTFGELNQDDMQNSQCVIGGCLTNTKMCVLDHKDQPVPVETIGEVYIGGAGVARGYLNRPELTSECFFADTFSDSVDARMYKTGDLARILPDGNCVIIGRSDQQVKIRGFRIELGEIEHCLRSHFTVIDAVVRLVGEEEDKRLVAYIVSEITDDFATVLYDYMVSQLPEYMIPSAFLRLEKLPLTPNGKLDTRALPSVDETSFLRGGYEAPETEIETTLATVWENIFSLEHVSRSDSFFALGGHSLRAMRVMDAMRIRGITVTIQDIFKYPVLSDLARTVESHQPLVVPPNVISPNLERLTPDMLPLIDLLQTDIDQITSEIPGGVANIQDIYELSPLQNGILFHHLLSPDNDSYLSMRMLAFGSYEQLSGYLTALQSVINRHDILRTSFFWEGISVPAQVVWRRATISLTQVTLENDNEAPCEELSRRYGRRVSRMNFREAPLIRLVISREDNGRWILLSLIHHIIYDERTLVAMDTEIMEFLNEHETRLCPPISFRNHIAWIRQNLSEEENMQFFTVMLTDIAEPTLPFGLVDMHGNFTQMEMFNAGIDTDTTRQLRMQAKLSGVSVSILCHLAWALIASRSSGQKLTVFGTVLSTRMRTGKIADAEMGLYINTLPVRLNIDETPVCSSVRNMQVTLANLLKHKHASLVSAQRCSHVPHGTPLFSSLMNYRHKSLEHTNKTSPPPFEVLQTEGNTNYPLVMSVDDDDEKLSLEVQVADRVEPFRICNYMREALANLTVAIANSPQQSICSIEVLPENERTLLLEAWNHNSRSTPDLTFVHRLFERQVQLRPLSTALVHEDETLTYEELNIRANRLARRLTGSGVVPESLVGICVSVSPAMIVALIAVLKAGGAYVPLDPDQPQQRLRDILIDAAVRIVIADEIGREKLGTSMLTAVTFIDPNARIAEKDANPFIQDLRLQNLAYVIYTSGSTGKPKGVMVEHRNIATFFNAMESHFYCNQLDVWCSFHSIAFDFSVWEIWGALRNGGRLVLMSRDAVRSPEATHSLICENRVTVLNQTPSAFRACTPKFIDQPIRDHLRSIILGGDVLDCKILQAWYSERQNTLPQFVMVYGTTETTVFSTIRTLNVQNSVQPSSYLGEPLHNSRVYLLDHHGLPVPIGAVGEIYVGGTVVTRGYLNRPQLTCERFLRDACHDSIDGRMYKTGDLARKLPNGHVEFVGRSDDQIKIRGFRVEPKEIEACLVTYPGLHQALVVASSADPDRFLVAYIVGKDRKGLAHILREYLVSMLPDYMIPSKFVYLKALPLTTNGKLDYEALPSPNEDAVARTLYKAPVSNTEWMLASIWGSLLGIDRIGRQDNFFALGGHSLLAVQMVTCLASRGLVCTLNNLFRFPVLGDLASRIVSNPTTWGTQVAIPVRPAGTSSPIFFVPTGHGDVSHVYSLSREICTDYPVYALPWPSFADERISSMQELARRMIALIRDVQRTGPYRLCGYSSGGVLCHAIADELESVDESIAFLGWIDTSNFNWTEERVQWKRHFLTRVLSANLDAQRQNDLVSLCQKMQTTSLIDLVEEAKQLNLLPSNILPEAYAGELKQGIQYFELTGTYKPRDLTVTIHQFNATEPYSLVHQIHEDLARYTGIPSTDWTSKLPNTSFRTIAIPGNHWTIMENSKNRKILGQAINESISE